MWQIRSHRSSPDAHSSSTSILVEDRFQIGIDADAYVPDDGWDVEAV